MKILDSKHAAAMCLFPVCSACHLLFTQGGFRAEERNSSVMLIKKHLDGEMIVCDGNKSIHLHMTCL